MSNGFLRKNGIHLKNLVSGCPIPWVEVELTPKILWLVMIDHGD